jgi:hypothetical protein
VSSISFDYSIMELNPWIIFDDVRFQSLRKIGVISRALWIVKFRNFTKKCVLPTNIHFIVKCRNSTISYFINIKLIFFKLWIFTNRNMVFLVVVLVFDFNEFSEGVLHGYSYTIHYSVMELNPWIIFDNVRLGAPLTPYYSITL